MVTRTLNSILHWQHSLQGTRQKWTDLSHHAQLSMCTSRDKMSASGMEFSVLKECEFVAVVSWKVGWWWFFYTKFALIRSDDWWVSFTRPWAVFTRLGRPDEWLVRTLIIKRSDCILSRSTVWLHSSDFIIMQYRALVIHYAIQHWKPLQPTPEVGRMLPTSSGGCLNMLSYKYRDSYIRQWWDHLIFIMEIPIQNNIFTLRWSQETFNILARSGCHVMVNFAIHTYWKYVTSEQM